MTELSEENRIWLQRKAVDAYPNEACGFIMDTGEILEVANISTTPDKAFQMDQQDMIYKVCNTTGFIAGIWHTHPQRSTVPSATDLHAIKIGAIQPQWKYWIVTADCVTEYSTESFAPQQQSFWESFNL